MKVVEKTVKRYYFDGKGYATKSAAYKSIARRELKEAVAEIVKTKWKSVDVENDDERFRVYLEAYATLFPPHGKDVQSHDSRGSFFCRKCRKEWIKRRMEELMREGATK